MIELMIVIVLVAILLALAMPSFNGILQRYRVNTAANQIANALQFARIEAIRTRANVIVGQTATTDPDCTTDGTITDWHCGVDVRNPTATLKTIPASSLQALNVRTRTGSLAPLVFTPMGYTCANAGCGTAPPDTDSFIYVWPTAQGNDFTTASVINTVCATRAGKIRVIPIRVAAVTDCNN